MKETGCPPPVRAGDPASPLRGVGLQSFGKPFSRPEETPKQKQTMDADSVPFGLPLV